MRIALAQINPIVGAFSYNREKILAALRKCREENVECVVFPEMAICGYPPEDLLLMPSFINQMAQEIELLIKEVNNLTAIIGCVRENPYGGEKFLCNSAAIIQDRELIGFQDKMLLPDYDVFSERRYFEPAARMDVWQIAGKKIAVTICEDIWQHAKLVEYSAYPKDPIEELKRQAPDLVLNLSASPFYLKRFDTRFNVCQTAARTLKCPVLFCNQVGGNDSLIFDGYSMVLNSQGELIQQAKGFEEDLLIFDTEKKYRSITLSKDPIGDLYSALVLGLKDYFGKLGFTKACLGLSGGIDSAVVCCIAKEALGEENVLGVRLPSRFTSSSSNEDAHQLATNLGIRLEDISIEKPFGTFLEVLEPYSIGKTVGLTEENLQARIRGVILMALSNKMGYIVLGTGNKSELAMGYSTLYGDMCGGLEVIGDVAKADVYRLAEWINREREIIPKSIIEKEPTAELKANQKDSDTLPPYDVLDIVIREYIEEHKSVEEIASFHHLALSFVKELVQKIHLSEYKRRQAPPGLRVTKKAFSIGRRFPIVQHWNMRF